MSLFEKIIVVSTITNIAMGLMFAYFVWRGLRELKKLREKDKPVTWNEYKQSWDEYERSRKTKQ